VSHAYAQELSRNPDVVVIGAGSAGIAAALTFIEEGKSVVVMEAADRIGGRAWTGSGHVSYWRLSIEPTGLFRHSNGS